MEYDRLKEPVVDCRKERIQNYKEFTVAPEEERSYKNKGDGVWTAGVPFCHSGCPLGKLDPGLQRCSPSKTNGQQRFHHTA